MIEIEERIDVIAAFTGGKILPILFSWKNRRYGNLKVASTWDTYEGEAKLHHITVTNDSFNCYELCLNVRNFTWNMVKVYHE
ncbi:MAG TPA: hypothetical protein DDW50_13775 [Firmicutes bacterium]|nr:hypothetical protein [Bacillota bacterium]